MQIRVDLLPRPPYDGLVILIDVLRSCTVAPLLFGNGLTQLHIATRIRRALELSAQESTLLIGERSGIPPEGFNYTNSPAALRQLPIQGSAVLVSENLPKTLPMLEGADHLLLASLFNADAVARRALELEPERMYLVGCGLWDQEDLDDTLAAGLLIARLRYLRREARFSGAARLALAVFRSFPDPLEALWRSSAGHYLRKLELADDLAVASQVSYSEHVPELFKVSHEVSGSLYSFTTHQSRAAL